jgi:broad specificity phosphatase PhoE
MRLILVRHGETIENRKGICQGHSPGKLSPEGIKQARMVGDRLRGERIDIVFCSDLKRAKDSAAEMLRDRDIAIRYLPLLRERSAGVFQGRPMQEIYNAEEENGRWDAFRPPDGETFGNLRSRAQVFLKQLEVEESAESVLVISHGGFLRMMLGIIMGKDLKESIAIPLENACYSIIEYDGSWHVKAINRIDHLSADPPFPLRSSG